MQLGASPIKLMCRSGHASRKSFASSVAAIVVIGCAGSAAGTGAAAGNSTSPAGCPARAPAVVPVAPVSNGPVLSGTVAGLRLCRYGSLPASRLRGQHFTRSGALIRALVEQLNDLAPVPKGPTSCPIDNGSEVLLRARYRGGKSADVTIGLSGCRVVARGRVRRSAEFSPGGPALLAHLVRLTTFAR